MSDITITQLFRHPVKSMMGESLQSLFLSEGGVPRDRAWAVKDEVRGGIRGGKKLPKLMHLPVYLHGGQPLSGTTLYSRQSGCTCIDARSPCIRRGPTEGDRLAQRIAQATEQGAITKAMLRKLDALMAKVALQMEAKFQELDPYTTSESSLTSL